MLFRCLGRFAATRATPRSTVVASSPGGRGHPRSKPTVTLHHAVCSAVMRFPSFRRASQAFSDSRVRPAPPVIVCGEAGVGIFGSRRIAVPRGAATSPIVAPPLSNPDLAPEFASLVWVCVVMPLATVTFVGLKVFLMDPRSQVCVRVLPAGASPCDEDCLPASP